MRLLKTVVLATLTAVSLSTGNTAAHAAAKPAPKNGDMLFADSIDGVGSQAPGATAYHHVTEGVSPKYSPDGRQIATLDSDPNSIYGDRLDVYVYSLATKTRRQVTHFNGTGTAGNYLDWAPDAKSVVTSNGNKLQRVNLSTGAISTIYTSPVPVRQPVWSPDGTQIAFSTGDTIKLVHPDGTGLRTFTTGGSNTMPDWRPDSRALAFITTRYTGSSEVVTLPRSGKGTPVRVSHLAYPQGLHHINVAWSPDSKKIAVLQFNANHEPNEQDTDERFKVRAYLADGSHSYSWTGPIVGDDGPEGLDWAPKLG